MAVASIDDLRTALADAAYDRVLGTPESGWIDFKGQAYALGTERGNWELCKDVAAFANARGGCILLGVAAERADPSSPERASELRPMPATVTNRERYRDLITVGVYPVPEGIELCTYPDSRGGCYLAVWIPAQSERARPFLVRYTVDENNRRLSSFGWPVRVDDAIVWQSCEQFQALLNLSGLLQAAATPKPQPVRIDPSSLNRHLRLLEATDDEGPSLALYLMPREPMDLTRSMYGDSSIAAAVRRRQPLRARGFNVTPHSSVDVRGPHGVEWGSRWRTAVDFDGVMMMTARVNDHSLAWNMARRNRPNLIMGIALTESVNDFFRAFYEAVVPLSERTYGCWSGHLVATDMQCNQVELMSGWSDLDPHERRLACSDDYRRSFDLTGSPDRDTFEALARFYPLFGLGAEDIPFVRDGAFSAPAMLQQCR